MATPLMLPRLRAMMPLFRRIDYVAALLTLRYATIFLRRHDASFAAPMMPFSLRSPLLSYAPPAPLFFADIDSL